MISIGRIRNTVSVEIKFRFKIGELVQDSLIAVAAAIL